MHVIGITGGVGAGKTKILTYLSEHYSCRIILADGVANQLKEPGQKCYEEIVTLLGTQILKPDGTIDRLKMAERIFSDRELLRRVNEIIHPAVKEYILQAIEEERRRDKIDFLFLEAALLIEEGYESVVDELWYIYADEAVRAERLKQNRQYSDEKIQKILQSQLSDAEYRAHCSTVIDNGVALEETYRQIEKKMGEYLWEK
ncbi:MAG: dephospho-CoA kinase [Lachnospiraceae bacterium]|nr:dephospho-CoA kinase [Lachnospiraceae bacterium]